MNTQETGHSAPTIDDTVVRLRLTRTAHVDVDRIPSVLGADNAPWLGVRMPEKEPAVRHYLCDLEMVLGNGHRSLLRKSAIVGFGAPVPDSDGWVVPIEWRAATLAPLFPVFAGRLRVGPNRIELDGRYAPPFGKVGVVMDSALLGLAARGTGRWFLQKLVAVLA